MRQGGAAVILEKITRNSQSLTLSIPLALGPHSHDVVMNKLVHFLPEELGEVCPWTVKPESA